MVKYISPKLILKMRPKLPALFLILFLFAALGDGCATTNRHKKIKAIPCPHVSRYPKY